MFINSEDFYFLTYNTIILLDVLSCVDKQRYFCDYRKISFLLDFVSDHKICYLLNKEKLNEEEIRKLTRIYSSGLIRIKELNKLFYSLDKKGIIHLSKRENSDEIDVSLLKSKLGSDFIDKNLFENEITNALKLKTIIKRIAGLKYETLKTKLFIEKGVKIWQLL